MKNKVARIWVDFDSLKVINEHEFRPFEILGEVLAIVKEEASVLTSQVYVAMGYRGNGSHIPQSEIFEVYKLGGTLVPVPSFPAEGGRLKSLVDPTMITDAVLSLAKQELLDLIVIVTNDKDFIPLVRAAKELGKAVWLFYGEQPAGSLLDQVRGYPDSRCTDIAEVLRNKMPEITSREANRTDNTVVGLGGE